MGGRLKKGEECGTLESVKAVAEVYMPVSGEIIGVNTALEASPGLINTAPYTDGWIADVKPSDPSEMDRPHDRQPLPRYARGLKRMRHLPHTEQDIAEMLETIGASSLDDLFSSVPEPCRRKTRLNLPGPLTEWELNGVMADLAGSMLFLPNIKYFWERAATNIISRQPFPIFLAARNSPPPIPHISRK